MRTRWPRLTRRADYIAARAGTRGHGALLSVQRFQRPPGHGAADANAEPARIGITITKKVGSAVERNRIKRRLRAAIDAVPAAEWPTIWRPGCDYVVFPRALVIDTPFAILVEDLMSAAQRAARRAKTRATTRTKGRTKVGRIGSPKPTDQAPA